MSNRFLPAIAVGGMVLAVLLCTAGCGGGSSPDDPSMKRDPDPPKKVVKTEDGGAPVAKRPAGGGEAYDAAKATGVVKGVVTLDGKAPTMLAIPVPDKGCADHRAGANMPALTKEDIVVKGDKIANVVVYVSGGDVSKYNFDNFNVPAARINQVGCQYTPHVLAMKTNQKLEIQSSDPIAHNIHGVPNENQEFNLSQPAPGILDTKPSFNTAEFDVKIKCDVHNWMAARVCVFDHVFFAVTKDDGTYEIKLPPGEYEINTWQETQTPFDNPKKWKLTPSGAKKVTVAADKPATADFVYKVK